VPAKHAPGREALIHKYSIRPSDLPDRIEFKEIEKRPGCPRCKGTGIVGRTLVCEAFYVDSVAKNLILNDAPLHEIDRAMIHQGGQTLGQAALLKAAAGISPLSEALGIIGVEVRRTRLKSNFGIPISLY
jgi:type II secretory ATPase GspE/PulE/Tfp pilus assembly ATPase PilB-like protein